MSHVADSAQRQQNARESGSSKFQLFWCQWRVGVTMHRNNMLLVRTSDLIKLIARADTRMRVSKRRTLWLCFGFFVFAVSFVIRDAILFYVFAARRLAHSSYFQASACPACFGLSLCSKLEDRLWLSPTLTDLRASFKGVRYAEWDCPSEIRLQVVAKSLAHAVEMNEFDAKLCLKMTGDRHCSVDVISKLTASQLENKPGSKGFFSAWDSQLNLSEYFTCPSTRLEEKVIRLYDSDGDELLSLEDQRILATTLQVNREPVILQLFPQEEGWPFPRYYGACGRVIIAENAGKPLTDYLNKIWEFRVWLSVQLLQIAFLLTSNNKGWTIYLTDMDPENFALSENGQVFAIDVEHAVVIDTQEMKEVENLEQNFKFEDPVCDHDNVNCATHSTEAMCQGLEKDHNFMYICKTMLGFSHHGRLLHNPPLKEKDIIESLLRDCIYYNSARPRRQAAKELYQYLVSLLPEGPDQADLIQN